MRDRDRRRRRRERRQVARAASHTVGVSHGCARAATSPVESATTRSSRAVVAWQQRRVRVATTSSSASLTERPKWPCTKLVTTSCAGSARATTPPESTSSDRKDGTGSSSSKSKPVSRLRYNMRFIQTVQFLFNLYSSLCCISIVWYVVSVCICICVCVCVCERARALGRALNTYAKVCVKERDGLAVGADRQARMFRCRESGDCAQPARHSPCRRARHRPESPLSTSPTDILFSSSASSPSDINHPDPLFQHNIFCPFSISNLDC